MSLNLNAEQKKNKYVLLAGTSFLLSNYPTPFTRKQNIFIKLLKKIKSMNKYKDTIAILNNEDFLK